MVVIGLLVTAVSHAEVFGVVLLMFAGMAPGHALAISPGLADLPGNDGHRGPRR